VQGKAFLLDLDLGSKALAVVVDEDADRQRPTSDAGDLLDLMIWLSTMLAVAFKNGLNMVPPCSSSYRVVHFLKWAIASIYNLP